MRLKIKFFSRHREIIGIREELVKVRNNANIKCLLKIIEKKYPRLKGG